jgi:hypothetical protein
MRDWDDILADFFAVHKGHNIQTWRTPKGKLMADCKTCKEMI